MTRTTRIGVLVLALVGLAALASADQIDGQTVLRNMFKAEGSVSFTAHQVTTLSAGPPDISGPAVYRPAGAPITSEQTLYRSGFDGMRLEYTRPPRLRGEIHADDGKVFAHLIPARKLLQVGPSRLAEMKNRVGRAGRGFRRDDMNVRLAGRDRVAGRPAYVVEVSPNRSGDHFTRKLWIDRDKWVKLKTEEIGPDGTILSTSYFTSITYVDNIPTSKFHISPPPGFKVEQREEAGVITLAEARKAAGFRLLEPTYLPDGFKAVGAKVRPFRGGQLVAIRYTDGVNSVSLFQGRERLLERHFLDRLHSGPVEPDKGVYTWRQSGLNLTLIGQLSQAELRKIADSVK